MTKIFKIILTLHRANGNSPPYESNCQSLYPQSFPNFTSYTSFLEQLIEEKSELEKSLEALQESDRQFQNILDSHFTQNFQDSHSPFPVPFQQIEQLVDLKKSIEILLESEQQIQHVIDL